jgi:hypothetical protein
MSPFLPPGINYRQGRERGYQSKDRNEQAGPGIEITNFLYPLVLNRVRPRFPSGIYNIATYGAEPGSNSSSGLVEADDNIITVNDNATYGLRQSGAGNFRSAAGTLMSGAMVASSSLTVFDSASLGSELLQNGDFATNPDTAWTWGTGWTHDTVNGEADHSSGTASLTQRVPLEAGAYYLVSLTLKNSTNAYGVRLYFDGVLYNSIPTNATTTRFFMATKSGVFAITPPTGFDGSIDDVSVKKVTGGNSVVYGNTTTKGNDTVGGTLAVGGEARSASVLTGTTQVTQLAVGTALSTYTPLGLWKFDETTGTTAADSSGNGYDLTLQADASTLTTAGVNGTALAFNGTTDYAKRAAATVTNTSGTVSVWIKPLTGGGTIVSSADEDTNSRYLRLEIDGYNRLYYVVNPGTQAIANGDGYCTPEEWSHVVFESSDTSITVYLNGKLQTLTWTTGSDTGSWFGDIAGRDNLMVGASKTSGAVANYLAGSIDDVRIYAETLTAAEVWDLYQGRGDDSLSGAMKIKGSSGINGSLVLDDGATEKITLTFTGGVLTGRLIEATTSAVKADWTD